MSKEFHELVRAILENYTYLACGWHYKKADDKAICPKCSKTRKEQVKVMES